MSPLEELQATLTGYYGRPVNVLSLDEIECVCYFEMKDVDYSCYIWKEFDGFYFSKSVLGKRIPVNGTLAKVFAKYVLATSRALVMPLDATL